MQQKETVQSQFIQQSSSDSITILTFCMYVDKYRYW